MDNLTGSIIDKMSEMILDILTMNAIPVLNEKKVT